MVITALTGGCVVIGFTLWTNRNIAEWGEVPDYLPGIGLLLAGLGLNTWQKQLKGTHEFELARRTLKAAYALRDAVRRVRHPFMSPSEAGELAGDETEKWESAAYQNRWSPVNEASRELDVALLEVEAMWSDMLKASRTRLRLHINKLFIATQNFLRARDERYADDFRREDSDVLYEVSSEDEYNISLNGIIAEFETELRPKLRN